MSQTIVFTLLALALALPALAAIVLRVLAPRMSPAQLYGSAALFFAVAVFSVLMLARGNVSSLQVGGLSLLLPGSEPEDQSLPLPPTTIAPEAPAATTAPTATAILAPTSAPTATAVVTATSAPTAEPPTAAPTAEPPTVAPTAEPPTAPPARRTYTVQPGDTLRSIAEQFNVSVQAIIDANNLTPEEADSLRVGQELVIP